MKFLYKPKGIVIHCTASHNMTRLETIFLDHVRRGYDCIGYHYVITNDGTVYNTRPINMYGAHAKGYNDHIGIAYIGGTKNGKNQNTMTEAQIESMGTLIYALMEIYKWNIIDVKLHNEVANKECPCFKADFLGEIIIKGQIPRNSQELINNIKMYGLCVHNQ